MQPTRKLEQHLLQARLYARRQVRVRALEFTVFRAFRRVTRKIEWSDAKAAVLSHSDRRAHVVEEARLTVTGQAHNFVLIGRAQKPQVHRQLFVEQSERMRQRLRSQHLEA